MINVGNKALKALYRGSDAVKRVYRGRGLVWSARMLPPEYKQVKFLRNTQIDGYVSTDLNGSAYDYADITLQCYSLRSNRQLMGHATNQAHYFGVSESGIFEIGSAATISKDYADPFSINVVRWEPGNERSDGYSKITINGYTAKRDVLKRISTTSFEFFTLNNSNYGGSYRIFGGKFYLADGTLVGDFVPCMRISDDTLGMFDLVTNKFKPCVGTFTYE